MRSSSTPGATMTASRPGGSARGRGATPAPRASLRAGMPVAAKHHPRFTVPGAAASSPSGFFASSGARRRRVLIGVAAVLTILIVAGLLLGRGPITPSQDVVVIAEKTTRAPGVLAPEVRQRVLGL